MNANIKISKKLKEVFGFIYKHLLQIFFPKKCPFCRELISINDYYCSDCYESLEIYDKESLSFQGLDNLFCCCYYSGKIQSTIWTFKFRSRPDYAEMFAKLAMEILGVRLKDAEFDLVLYAPMHPKKEKLRGYNQAEVLAKELAKELNIPLGNEILKKVKDNATQHELSAIERHKNVKGVYSVTCPEAVMGKRILLVDDIFTTGATLCECGRWLHMEHADLVCGFTIARAVMLFKDDEPFEKDFDYTESQVWEDADCEIADLLLDCQFQPPPHDKPSMQSTKTEEEPDIMTLMDDSSNVT